MFTVCFLVLCLFGLLGCMIDLTLHLMVVIVCSLKESDKLMTIRYGV